MEDIFCSTTFMVDLPGACGKENFGYPEASWLKEARLEC